LFVAGIAANDVDDAAATHNLAVFANAFDAGSDLHGAPNPSLSKVTKRISIYPAGLGLKPRSGFSCPALGSGITCPEMVYLSNAEKTPIAPRREACSTLLPLHQSPLFLYFNSINAEADDVLECGDSSPLS
jgi:hypothetical protein